MNLLTRVKELPEKSKIAINLCGVQGLFWGMWAFSTYSIVYLQEIGFTASQIGNINAISSLVAFFSCMLLGMLSDKLNSIKKVAMGTVLCLGIFYPLTSALPTAHSYIVPMFFIYYAFVSVFKNASVQLMENLTIRNCALVGANYGIIRAFGSFVFSVFSIIVVTILNKFGIISTFVGFAIMCGLAVLVMSFSKDPKVEVDSKKEKRKISLKPLLKNYYYVTFIIFAGILFIAISADISFLPYMMRERGISTDYLGTYFSVRAFTEIPLLIFTGKLRNKFKVSHLIIFGTTLMTVQFFFIGLWANNLTYLLMFSIIYGIGNGIFIGNVPYYLFNLADEHLKASAQTVYGSICAISGIVGNIIGGYMFEILGASLYYISLGTIFAVAVAFFTVSLKLKKNVANQV